MGSCGWWWWSLFETKLAQSSGVCDDDDDDEDGGEHLVACTSQSRVVMCTTRSLTPSLPRPTKVNSRPQQGLDQA